MASGFINCMKHRMEDMWLPFPDTILTSVASVIAFVKSAATCAKTLDGQDYTLFQLLRVMAAGGTAVGTAAQVEQACNEVLAVSGAFYLGALSGSLLICTTERLIKGPDKYSPKLSIFQIKTKFRQKMNVDMPVDVATAIATNPEMAGGAIGLTWGSRWENQFYASQGEELV